MKKSAIIILLIGLGLTACTTQKQTAVNDDVYFSPGQASTVPVDSRYTTTTAQVLKPQSTDIPPEGSATVVPDDNDYSYSAQIERFNNRDTTKGYFDETFTGNNSGQYTESSDPNVNITFALGAGFGGYYGMSPYWGYGWGYPYWGWDYWWGYPYSYYPWYGYGYGGYWNGYYNGYWNGYWDGYYGGGYYPPYYADTYYGSRRPLTTSDGGNVRNARSANELTGTSPNRNTRSVNELNTKQGASAVNTRRSTPDGNLNQRNTSTGKVSPRTPANQEKYRYTQPAARQQSAYQRSTTKSQEPAKRQQATPRYAKPGGTQTTQRSTQNYTSPTFRQPRSSQEYLSPKVQNVGASSRTTTNKGTGTATQRSNTSTRQYAAPTSNTRSYSTPGRSSTSGYSTPSRTNSGNTQSTRSSNRTYSTPSSSGSSYSTPSRSSGGSYSAPSRSGGGTSAPSGGSSGGGGGRRR